MLTSLWQKSRLYWLVHIGCTSIWCTAGLIRANVSMSCTPLHMFHAPFSADEMLQIHQATSEKAHACACSRRF